jgi:hypothetical protein
LLIIVPFVIRPLYRLVKRLLRRDDGAAASG